MSSLNNTPEDRQRIRSEIFHPLHGNPEGVTPVLLMFWTKHSLDQFLIPCTEEDLKKLLPLNGIDENGTSGWDNHIDTFKWLKNKIAHSYEDDDGGDHPQGEWREKYYLDVFDPVKSDPLPASSLPPGTVLVVTGIIL